MDWKQKYTAIFEFSIVWSWTKNKITAIVNYHKLSMVLTITNDNCAS